MTDGQIADIQTSPEFPCRTVRDPNSFSLTLSGVDNSNFLTDNILKRRCFRLRYRLDLPRALEQEDGAAVDMTFIPLNNVIKFSYSYGNRESISAGVGGQDVRLIYFMPQKEIVSSWISPPWKMTISVSSVKRLVSKILPKSILANGDSGRNDS